MSAPSVKPSVMFADHVSTLGASSPSLSVISAAPRKLASKRGALTSMLIGLMSIVFGLGIMYLLSRLMQVSRRQQQLERQLKDTSTSLDDLSLQLHMLVSAPRPQPLRASAPASAPSPAPLPPDVTRYAHVPTFVDFPLPLLFDDGNSLLDFFVQNTEATAPPTCKVEEIEEIVGEGEDASKAKAASNVKFIVQQTMQPIAQVVDELKKQSEQVTASSESSKDNSSSDSDDEKTVTKQEPARRSTRATAASRRKK